VLSWSRATRDLLKSFGWGIGALHRLATATMVPSPRRLPHSISGSHPRATPPAATRFVADSALEGDGFEPSVPRLRRNSARLAGRDATRVRNTIGRVDQLEREKAGRSHRLQAASTSSTSIDSPEHGVPGAVFGRDADLDVLLVVEGDALHQATEDLGCCVCAGSLPHSETLILAPHAAHASRDIDPYALARVSWRRASENTRPDGSFEEAEQLVWNEAGA
jgi:hypothetical protein